MLIAAYGLGVDLQLPHPELPAPAAIPDGPELRATLAGRGDIEAAFSGPCVPPRRATATVDDVAWDLERGLAGDARVGHGQTRLHIDPAAKLLRCAPADPQSPAWQRILLDTALVTASLIRGLDALHAAAVSRGGSCVALVGARGAGKTSIALEALRGGATLVADDVVAIARGPGAEIVAHVAPPLANLPATMSVTGIGEVLHDFGEELWVRVERVADGPQALTAVVVIDRDENHRRARLEPLPEPAVALLSHALHSGADRDRRERRFALLADLAERVPAMRLAASPAEAPARLADLLGSELGL